jgi:hypothetical protein
MISFHDIQTAPQADFKPLKPLKYIDLPIERRKLEDLEITEYLTKKNKTLIIHLMMKRAVKLPTYSTSKTKMQNN